MSYKAQEVLKGVTLEANEGTAGAIIGKNGSGKSTLLAIMAGMLRPGSGSVFLDGGDIFRDNAKKSRIGYLPQGDILFGDLSVRDNLNFWGRAAGMSAKETGGSELITQLGLDKYIKKRVCDLSGGMRRRAAIAACLISGPDLILLDEPFSGLDLIYREELKDFLLPMKQAGKTIIYTTHSPGELEGLSDSVMLLSGGKIAFTKPAAEINGDKSQLNNLFLTHLRREEE